MSSTRHAKQGSPLSDERYMSSPDFVLLRGISGTAVATRCKAVDSPVKRELLFFLQAMSLKQGGLNKLATEILKMFPNRVGTPTMRKLGMSGAIKYSGSDINYIDTEIAADFTGDCDAELSSLMLREEYLEARDNSPVVGWQAKMMECREAALKVIPEFIIELCINPKLEFHLPGQPARRSPVSASEAFRTTSAFDSSSPGSKRRRNRAEIQQFEDIVGALFEYKRQYENSVVAGFCHTVISRQIWDELDRALKTRTMGLINGLPGRGKTEAVRAWCECHMGVARFVTLDGTSTKTAQFRELSRALGVGHGNSRKAQEMQGTVKEILQSSGIMPVIDEAHFFFEQGTRIRSRPEMLDWIDTALCNPPIPVALVTTPQFMTCMERAAIHAEWNYLQFQRRCKRTIELPHKNTPSDVKAVVRHLLPTADGNIINLILGYEKLSGRDLSAVGDAVREAKRIAEESGDDQVSFEHVDQAINELVASDQPWAVLRRRVAEGLAKRKSGRRIAVALDLSDSNPCERSNHRPDRISEATPVSVQEDFSRGGVAEEAASVC